MRPVLFRRWGLTIASYPALLYAGLVAGVVAGNAAAHSAGVDALRVFVATFTLIVPSLIGARLFYVVTHLRFYRQDPRRIWRRREGGLSLYGGLVCALFCSVPVLAALRLSRGVFWDVAVFTLLVGMVFARIGCWLNGCCAGRLSGSWLAPFLPNPEGVWGNRLPTQCLELGWAVVLLILAIAIWPRLPFPGALFWIVAGGYAAGRLFLESTREPLPGASRFTINHGISIVIILLSVATLTARWPE